MPGKDGQKKQILYDTTIVIGYLRGNKACKEKIENVRTGKIAGFISVVTIFELYVGAFLSKNVPDALKDVKELLSWFQPPLDLEETSAQKAAYLFARLQKTNELIGLSDFFIASTALTVGLPISTLNKSHFSRIHKLKIID